MIHDADKALKERWAKRFAALPPDSRAALREALLDLRQDAAARARLQWKRCKAPMALYWKVISVYALHLSRALR